MKLHCIEPTCGQSGRCNNLKGTCTAGTEQPSTLAFSSYLIFKVARTAFLFLERQNDVNYFYAFWITEVLQCFATLCVIKELFDNAFEQHLGLRRLGNVLFQWSITILIVIAVLIAFTTPE